MIQEQTNTGTTTTTPTEQRESWPDTAARLAGIIAHYPVHNRGDLAQLRRMDPEEPDAPAFWRLTNQHRLGMSTDSERRWALILQSIALLTPNTNNAARVLSAHDPRTPVGRALFQGGDPQRTQALCHEQRLEQLLSSRRKDFRRNLMNLVRMMAQQGTQMDFREMARLVLDEDRDPEAHRRRLNRIPRDYYRAEHRASGRQAAQG